MVLPLGLLRPEGQRRPGVNGIAKTVGPERVPGRFALPCYAPSS